MYSVQCIVRWWAVGGGLGLEALETQKGTVGASPAPEAHQAPVMQPQCPRRENCGHQSWRGSTHTSLDQCYPWVREEILIPRHYLWPAGPGWLCGFGNSYPGLEQCLSHFFPPFFFPVLGISQAQSIRRARPGLLRPGYRPALSLGHFSLGCLFSSLLYTVLPFEHWFPVGFRCVD